MGETKFIFTADDSQLQSAIERVKKSLNDIGVIAESSGKAGDSAFGGLSSDLGDVEKRTKDASNAIDDYSGKIKTLKSEISSLETEVANMPVGNNDAIKEKQEQIKELTEQMKELQKLESDQLEKSGVKFTFSAPTPVVDTANVEPVTFSETANFDKTIEQLEKLRGSLAETRAEYEQLSQRANTGDTDLLQLAYTNDAIEKTKERFTELSNAYFSANATLDNLIKELDAAKATGDNVLSNQISTQIAQLSPIVTELKKEYDEIVSRGEELGSQKLGLTESIKDAEQSSQVTRDYATEVKILKQELEGLKSQLDGLNVSDKEQEAHLTERIKELRERIAEIRKLEAQQLQNSGVSFTLVTPEPTQPSAGLEQGEFVSNAEKIKEQTDALASSREEYEKLLAAIKDTDGNMLKLANTNDALNATFSRIGTVSDTLKLTSNELKNLNAELEKAKANGDAALKESISRRIDEVKAKVPALNKELQELVKKEEQLKQKRQELLQLTRESRVENTTTASAQSEESVESSSKGGGIFSTESLESAATSMGALSKGMSQVTQGFKQMATGGAGAAKGLNMVTGGIKMMSKALLTLLANPIVLIITAIVASIAAMGKALSMYFTKTSEGADKFAKLKGVFESAKIVIENFAIEVGRKLSEFGTLVVSVGKLAFQMLTLPAKIIILSWRTLGDTLIGVMQGLIEGFRTGDWGAVGDNIRESIGEAIDSVIEEIDQARENIEGIQEAFNGFTPISDDLVPENLVARVQQIEADKRRLIREEKAWALEKARLEEQRSELQEDMYSGSQTEQIAAMDSMRDLTNQKYAKEISLAQERLRIQRELNALRGNNITIEEQDKERELQIALNRLVVQQNSELRTMARRYKSVTSALEEQRKSSEKELNKLRSENEKLSRSNTHNAEVDMLKLRIKYENDANEKLRLQQELREKNLKYQKQELEYQKQLALEQNEIDKQSNIKKVYGEEALEEYKQTGTLANDSEGRLAFYEGKEKQIERKFTIQVEGAEALSERGGEEEELETKLTNFEKYLQGMLDAEQAYQDELAAIREKYGLEEDADVETSTNANIRADVESAKTERVRSQQIVKRDTRLEDEKLVTDLANLGASVAGKAKDEIRKEYDRFIDEVNKQIDKIDVKQATEAKIIENESLVQEQKNEQLSLVEKQLEGGVSDPNQEAELLAQKAQLEQEITESINRQADARQRLNELIYSEKQLVAARTQAEKSAASSVSKASNTSDKQWSKQKKTTSDLVKSLAAVRDAADAIADTFGGALSKSSKKALEAVSEIASVGINSIQSIESVVQSVSSGVFAASEAGVTGIQMVERASVILTIISLVIQAITAIVNLAKKFSTSEQLKEAIEEHRKKAEDLRRENEKLQRAFQDKSGIDYYKGMAKAAKDMTKEINELKEAQKDAASLMTTTKEGSEDYESAKENYNNLSDEIANREEEQADQLRQVAEELATTDYKSFSQSLAESVVEGFADGMDGIEDVFDDTMDNLYRSMLTKQLALAFEKQFEPVFAKIEELATDANSLTQNDIDYIMGLMDSAEEGAKSISEAYYEIFSERGLLDDMDTEGSEGFGQMTQDQADALTARFTAVQIEMANVSAATQAMAGTVTEVGADMKLGVAGIQSLLENSSLQLLIAQDQLSQLEIIADNTAILSETNTRLKAIESHTSKL